MRRFSPCLIAALIAAGCFSGPKTPGELGTFPVTPAVPPDHVQVQHILIGFKGTIPGRNIARTRQQADSLAQVILTRVRYGADFDQAVRDYTDDSYPGIYGMSNRGVPPGKGEYPRDGIVTAFGDVGFGISVGNIGFAEYDPVKSPYGWHIIKRLK